MSESESAWGDGHFCESIVEQAALEWLQGLGYECLSGPAIGFGQPDAERLDPGFKDVLLDGRLKAALRLGSIPAFPRQRATRRFES